jgi:sugar phosphate isomerase/epimerase
VKDVIISIFADETYTDFNKQLWLARQLGIPGIEIRFISDGGETKSVVDIPIGKHREYKAKFDAAHKVVSAVATGIGKDKLLVDGTILHKKGGILTVDQYVNDPNGDFRKALAISQVYGTDTVPPRIRLFSFYLGDGLGKNIALSMVEDIFYEMGQVANDSGVTLVSENERGLLCDVPGYVSSLLGIEKVRGSGAFVACHDPANYIHSGIDPVRAYAVTGDLVDHIHAKDCLAIIESDVWQPVPAEKEFYLLPGMGDGGFRELFKARRGVVENGDGPEIIAIEGHLNSSRSPEGQTQFWGHTTYRQAVGAAEAVKMLLSEAEIPYRTSV